MNTPKDLSNRRCGECGEKGFTLEKIHGIWNRPWKDFPVVFMNKDHFVWQCNNCKNEAVSGALDGQEDALIEGVIRSQASQFLDIIKSKSGLKIDEIAKRLGFTPNHISDIRGERKTPSYSLWSMLKLCARYPEHLKDGDVLDPKFNIEDANILLRA